MKKLVAVPMILILMLGFMVALNAQDDALINMATTDLDVSYLTDADGMTLYSFSLDDNDCTGGCLESWPPLLVDSADDLSLADGIPGELGTFDRDGALQVTYNGMPLYYWIEDVEAGDTTGDGAGNVWFIVEPVLVYTGGINDLGRYLVGPNGMTLYMLTADEANTSVCSGDCLASWPPLTVTSEDDLTLSRNLRGELAVFEREDSGELQVSYNGIPLYYWANDAVVGDATGQGVGDVWFVVHPETVAIGGNDDLGDFLVGPNGMTLYMLTADSPDNSVCADGCLTDWPALLVDANDVLVAGEGLSGELTTFERADGGLQVQYNGMPLYYWASDVEQGDATGQGVGDVWFVIEAE